MIEPNANVLRFPAGDSTLVVSGIHYSPHKLLNSLMTVGGQSDPLKNLVIVMIGRAILGTFIALAWNYAVDLPTLQAAALHVPMNRPSPK
jgi:hypothetical protein